jgi:hypothetical protein
MAISLWLARRVRPVGTGHDREQDGDHRGQSREVAGFLEDRLGEEMTEQVDTNRGDEGGDGDPDGHLRLHISNASVRSL